MAVFVDTPAERLGEIIDYPVVEFLSSYQLFLERDEKNILNYYDGTLSVPVSASFNELSRLSREAVFINDRVDIHRERIDDAELWDVMTVVDDANIHTQTLQNANKFLRSSVNNSIYSPQPKVSKVLGQNQSLEDLSRSEGSRDAYNDWIEIARENGLIEEDYTSQGQIDVIVSGQNQRSITLQSVVGAPRGEEVYGRDIKRVLTFKDDDLEALSPEETFSQTCGILINLRRGDNPEFPDHGLSSEVAVGTNRGDIVYASLFRQIYANFQRDDTIRSITIVDLEIVQDSLFLTINIESQLEGALEMQMTI